MLIFYINIKKIGLGAIPPFLFNSKFSGIGQISNKLPGDRKKWSQNSSRKRVNAMNRIKRKRNSQRKRRSR